MTGVNFHLEEFRCPHCGISDLDPNLRRVLERIRTAIGSRPIRIISGYRCPVYNRFVGGALHSQHMFGRAADIPSALVTPAQARAAGATGIGIAGDWCVHVDVRPPPVVTWRYS